MKYWFWKEKLFSWYVAKNKGEILWYALYHYWFDPDEMNWKVIHLVDFFVSAKARRMWIGTKLFEKLKSENWIIAIYFWVWLKNEKAIHFYKKIWADWVDDCPYMRMELK